MLPNNGLSEPGFCSVVAVWAGGRAGDRAQRVLLLDSAEAEAEPRREAEVQPSDEGSKEEGVVNS